MPSKMAQATDQQLASLLQMVANANSRGIGIEFLGAWGARAAQAWRDGLLEARRLNRELGGVEYWLTKLGRAALSEKPQ